jgi:hypothetical protein
MFHKEKYMKFVDADYMAKDPKGRQEVFSDGGHISGNSFEPSGWSLENDNGAYKPGREWTHKSFFINTVYASAHLHPMLKKVPQELPKQDGVLGRCASHAEPHLVEDVCEGVGEDCRLAAGLPDLHSESRHRL